jgi:glycosyltransferase involved in cell wall biosynthesis
VMPSVAILLCTLNGERFLPSQLASLAGQRFGNWTLHVSDDGSTDGTAAILSQYAGKQGGAAATIRTGPRQGFVANFLSLACDETITGDYFAYSDQDDIWEPDKLSRAVQWLEAVAGSTPAMYCSRTRLIDEEDRECGLSRLFPRKPSFRNALVQSIAGGNTMVFNAAARRLLMTCGKAVRVPSHDWWTYLLTTAAGGVVHYDPLPMVRYRVHPENLVGANVGLLNRVRRVRMLARGRFEHWAELNVAALEQFRSQMTSENRAVFDLFRESRKHGFIRRQIGFLNAGVYRQTFLDNLGLLVATWTGKI